MWTAIDVASFWHLVAKQACENEIGLILSQLAEECGGWAMLGIQNLFVASFVEHDKNEQQQKYVFMEHPKSER